MNWNGLSRPRGSKSHTKCDADGNKSSSCLCDFVWDTELVRVYDSHWSQAGGTHISAQNFTRRYEDTKFRFRIVRKSMSKTVPKCHTDWLGRTPSIWFLIFNIWAEIYVQPASFFLTRSHEVFAEVLQTRDIRDLKPFSRDTSPRTSRLRVKYWTDMGLQSFWTKSVERSIPVQSFTQRHEVSLPSPAEIKEIFRIGKPSRMRQVAMQITHFAHLHPWISSSSKILSNSRWENNFGCPKQSGLPSRNVNRYVSEGRFSVQ